MAVFSQYRPIPTSMEGASKDAVHSWHRGVRLEVLANLAHELRTPVQVLLGYLEILLDELAGELHDEPREIIERMNSNVHELSQTVENLMEFAMAQESATPRVEEVFEVRELVGEVMRVVDAVNRNKNLEIGVVLSGSPEVIGCCRRALRAILSNLASNAVKFTGSGSVTISVTEGAGQGGAESLVVEVHDTGPGIEPELVERAFESLRQLSASSARRFRGLGLGLAVVHRNVGALGGTLEVKTAAGKGSIFKVTVPCRIVRRGRPKGFSRKFGGGATPVPIDGPKSGRRIHHR